MQLQLQLQRNAIKPAHHNCNAPIPFPSSIHDVTTSMMAVAGQQLGTDSA
jgi:hypothetical protein